jgi:hypothetical protein
MVTVISGAQTGVDRAALDAAIATGVAYRGWCPKGGWAEDCPKPPGVRARYPGLRETLKKAPEERTEWNVRDADGLMVLVDQQGVSASRGTKRAVATAEDLRKPFVIIDFTQTEAMQDARTFLRALNDKAVCVAGPRESEAPGIHDKAYAFLVMLLGTGNGPVRRCLGEHGKKDL